jgi:hypothetical protein
LHTRKEKKQMAYDLEALIGKGALAAIPLGYRIARLLPLRHELWLLPLTSAFYAELSAQHPAEQAPHVERIEEVSVASNLAELTRRLSETEPVAYVEAHFFGGSGGQSAIVWQQGQVRLALSQEGTGAINQALRCLGVRATSPGLFDEFEMVGLGRRRSTEGWQQEGFSGDRREWEAQGLVQVLARAEEALRELSAQSPLRQMAQKQKEWAEQRLRELSQKEGGLGAARDSSDEP